MTYQVIDNFAAGLDTRKSPLTSPSGTLTRLTNAVITPGGEISKRYAFTQIADLTGSFGLAATATRLWVFGRNVAPPVPSISVTGGSTITIAGLKVPNGSATLQQTDFDVFNGLIYLATYDPAGTPGVNDNSHYYATAVTAPAIPSVMTATEGNQRGYNIRTYQSKVYAVQGAYLYFSAINDPTKWVPETPGPPPVNVGAGYIVLSSQDASGEMLSGLEVYYDKLAIFSNSATQIWAIDPDQAQNAFEQLLRGAGTTAPRSALQYGSGDVLYLDPSGIRSLKARDSSNSAAVSDIGSPVDTVLATMRASGVDMTKAISLLEPVAGRFWLVFPNEVLVLSYFPGPQVTAWSRFTLTFTVQHALTCNGRIFFRDTANRLWVYGDSAGVAYDACGVEVRLPYLDGKKPGHKKQFSALDATLSGTWRVAISYDFNNPDQEETVATLSYPNGGGTWNSGAGEVTGYDSHFSLRFYNTDSAAATISNAAIHYSMGADED